MIRKENRKIAFCYDFDKTLSTKNMQEYKLIPSFAKNTDEFWSETKRLARTNCMDNNLAWMYQLVEESIHNHKPLNRQYIMALGKGINLGYIRDGSF